MFCQDVGERRLAHLLESVRDPLRKLIDFDVPALRVTYRLQEVGEPTLADVLREHGLIGDTALV